MDGELLLIINQSQQTFQVASRDCKDPLGGAPGLGDRLVLPETSVSTSPLHSNSENAARVGQ